MTSVFTTFDEPSSRPWPLPATVLLDRDGTVNVKAPEGEYIRRPEHVELIRGAASAIERLNRRGVTVAVVTNQRGVARGLMTTDEVDDVHRHLDILLASFGARIDVYAVCPHDLDSCGCRKPAPGLAETVLRHRPGTQLDDAVVIGDAASDIGFGHALGLRTIRIGAELPGDPSADAVVPSLAAAVDLLLGPVR